MGNLKEIKKEIRQLKKLKLQCQPGSAERLDLGHKIKDLKRQLVEVTRPEPERDNIITEILRIETKQNIKPTFAELGIDLHKYTIEQLKIHLKKISKGLDR